MNTAGMARILGQRGGRARSRRLSATDKKRIAALGAEARRQSLLAARRIADNFLYAAAVADLRRSPTVVTRMKTCAGPLPGLYVAHT